MNDQPAPPALQHVTRLAARGEGQTEGGRFIPGAIPGDRVDGQGHILPGPHHREPPCRHFRVCGGCKLQHVDDALLVQFVTDRVLEPLTRVGIVPTRVMPAHLSPEFARRRAAMRATRTDGEVRLGFNMEGAHSLVDIEECPILHPTLFALVPPLRRLLGPFLAERSAIGITVTLTDNGPDLLLTNLQANSLPVIEGLVEFAKAHGLARLSTEGPMGVECVFSGAPPSIMLGGVEVVLPPAAFLQATADGEAALISAVSAIVGKAKSIADLFSGVGTFTFPLSTSARLMAADGAGPAIRALEQAARTSGRPITTQHRDLFRKPLPAEELNRFQAIVIDPPRAGAAAQMAHLAQSQVPVVAAVSCNPATFARDAQTLVAGGYRLHRIWPIGQFRWSTHVELAAEFRR